LVCPSEEFVVLPIQRVVFLGVIAALIGGAEVRAQNPIDADGYVAVVLRGHPAARQSTGLVELGQAERRAVGRWPDPVFDISMARARPGEPAIPAGAESGFGITQAIPWPGARSASIRAGDRGAEAFAASADAVRWDVIADARQAFSRLVLSRALVAILRTAEEDTRSLRDLVARRAELGESRESDRLKTTVEWLKQRRILSEAERVAAAAEATVRTLAVEPLPRPLVIRDTPSPDIVSQNHDQLVALVVQRHPRLREAQAEAERRRALTDEARQSRAPSLAVSLFHAGELDKSTTGVAVGVTVPLWNANRGGVARAMATQSLAAAQAERLRVDLLAEFEARFSAFEVSAEQVRTLSREILPAAADGLKLARFSYEEGETSLLDLLDAQRTFRESQRELMESRLALTLAVTELQRLLGPDFTPWR
jgi:cobalt-zinc-cadmium efflux system outer membrane protein